MRSHQQFNFLSPLNVWETPRLFWSDDRVKEWYDAIFPKDNFSEACHNLMCLNPLAHRYYANRDFTLKPIELSVDEKTVEGEMFLATAAKVACNVCQ
jgi:hypothetical protein